MLCPALQLAIVQELQPGSSVRDHSRGEGGFRTAPVTGQRSLLIVILNKTRQVPLPPQGGPQMTHNRLCIAQEQPAPCVERVRGTE